jgi:hypothetical protein
MPKETPEQRTQVARIILEQLGGRTFTAMTGSHALVAHRDALSMRLRRNVASAQYLKITLDPSDTYTMEFTRFHARSNTLKTVRRIEGQYCDQLQERFTEVTGLHTRL